MGAAGAAGVRAGAADVAGVRIGCSVSGRVLCAGGAVRSRNVARASASGAGGIDAAAAPAGVDIVNWAGSAVRLS